MLRTRATVYVAAAAVLVFMRPAFSQQPAPYQEICDVDADSALGLEDYATAIRLHSRILRSHQNDALVHYHLGFAYGMVGRLSEEVEQYRTAATLGLAKWDLFLNLGLAYAERGELSNASTALEHAVLLGPERGEAHFNLAIVYERENMLSQALREITIARRLEPHDLDVSNTNAILCAETGDFHCAHNLWTYLVQSAPDYSPARANLAILSRAVNTDAVHFDGTPALPLSIGAPLYGHGNSPN